MTGGVGNALDRARVRWRQANPLLRFLAQVAIIAIVALSGFAVLRIWSAISETAASVLVAVVFGIVTFLQAHQTRRRQHTVDLITKFQSTDTLCAADTWMAERIASRRPVDSGISPDERFHVVTMLDYYEFLATLALRGIIDMRLLLRLRGGAMMRCLDLCRDYVTYRRTAVGDEIYRSFEMLADEHSRRMTSRRGASKWTGMVKRMIGIPGQRGQTSR